MDDTLPEPYGESLKLQGPRTIAGRFEVRRPLGRGGMGDVWLAWDRVLAREVAIKTLRTDRVDPSMRERWTSLFLQEARSTAQLRHPGVVALYDYGIHEGEPFLVLEYLRGTTLADVLSTGPLAVERVGVLMRHLIDALCHAHERGVVHRDLKPANLFVEPGDQLRIMDFGLALLAGGLARTTMVGGVERPGTVWVPMIAGTPGYMAPEQSDGASQGPTTDVWALGVIACEMLTGRRPGEEACDLPPSWQEFVHACLRPVPSERPTGRAALMACLEGAAAGSAEPRRVADRGAWYGSSAVFEGRQDEVAALERLLDADRVVSMSGPAGVGKSALARELARRAFDRGDDVALCEVSAGTSDDGLLQAVARALAVSAAPDEVRAAVARALARRESTLVILDGVDQLRASAPVLAEWFAAGDSVRWLIVSRHRRPIGGARRFVLGTLAAPTSAAVVDVCNAPAVQCLLGHAARHDAGLEVDDDNAADVAALVQLLDGLPLAMALAAPRLRLMSVRALRARLVERLPLLSSRAGEGDPRHVSLRDAVHDAWEPLSSDEQRALGQCSVFVRGFTLDAAEAVVDLSDGARAPFVIDVIDSLVDRSLLQVTSGPTPGDEPRFSMLSTVREFATGELARDAQALRAAKARHATFFALHGIEQRTARRGMSTGRHERRSLMEDADNIVAAAHHAAEAGLNEVFDGLGYAITELTPDALTYRDARSTLAELLVASRACRPDPGEVLWLRACAASNELSLGEIDEAMSELHAVLGDIASIREPFRRVHAALWAWQRSHELPHDREAAAVVEATVERAQRDGNLFVASLGLVVLGMHAQARGLRDEAAGCYERAGRVAGEVHQRIASIASSLRGQIALSDGAYEGALRSFETALGYERALGEGGQALLVAVNYARTLTAVGRHEEARDLAHDAMETAGRAGSVRIELVAAAVVADALRELGDAAGARSHARRALELVSAAGPTRHHLQVRMTWARCLVAFGEVEVAWEAMSGLEVDASSVGPAFAAELLVFQIDLSHRLGRPEAAEKPFAELARLHIDYKTNMRVSSCFDEAQRRFGAPAPSEM